MKPMTIALLVPAVLAIWTGTAAAQQTTAIFSLPDTTHHFLLNRDGGVIYVEAVNPDDTISPELIRTQLARIAMTGLSGLNSLNSAIHYSFEVTDLGGQIVIRTADPKALNAIHDYLRFEIFFMQTNDSGRVE